MLDIESVNHVGIRIADRSRSVPFYAGLGFELIEDAGFDDGHPIIMKHPSGVILNLLGPANVVRQHRLQADPVPGARPGDRAGAPGLRQTGQRPLARRRRGRHRRRDRPRAGARLRPGYRPRRRAAGLEGRELGERDRYFTLYSRV